MNGVLIVTGIIFLICMLKGLNKGLAKIAASLAATGVVMIFVTIMSPYVSDWILRVTPLETFAQEKCMEMLNVNLEGRKFLEMQLPRTQQISMIENADIPEYLQKLLLKNNKRKVYRELGAKTFPEYVCGYIANKIAYTVGFLLTLFVTSFIVHAVIYTLGLISDLPVVGGVNRIAGGALGLGMGLLIVWVLFIVITLICGTSLGKLCFENIESSRVLTFLYDNNILLNFIMKYR